MKIPDNVKTYEMRRSIIWVDAEGIVYSTPKPDAVKDATMEEIAADVNAFKKIIGHEKVCIITESNPNSNAPNKEMRDFLAEQLSSVVKAIAIISTSPLSRMIASLFFLLKPPPYPVKLVANVSEAKEWIKEVCK